MISIMLLLYDNPMTPGRVTNVLLDALDLNAPCPKYGERFGDHHVADPPGPAHLVWAGRVT
jgi:hypothetical protein